MNRINRIQVLHDVLVPISMITCPDAFGGMQAGDCLRGDLQVVDGKVAGLLQRVSDTAPTGLVLPPLVEAHCHLDKCHTADRLATSAFSLLDAIALQASDKHHWTDADLRRRISRGLEELAEAGVGLVRSHIDYGTRAPPLGWSVLAECARDVADRITVQPAALTDVMMMKDPAVADGVARQVRDAQGALGAFVYGRPSCENGLRMMFHLAEKYGLPLDFHVDEGMDPELGGVEQIADLALEAGHAGPILCGHACALSVVDAETRARVLGKLARAGIVVATLPSTNLYLQDRDLGAAARRGLAPVAEMLARGVRVVAGVDNVCDAFCPVGRHDPLWSLGLALLAAQLSDKPGTYLPMVTTAAAGALGHASSMVDGAELHDLLFIAATSTSDLICTPPARRQRLSDLRLEAIA